MILNYLHAADEQERDYSMLPDDFDFAMMPEGTGEFTLKEVGMMTSTIEDIDYAIVSWMKEDLELKTHTNEGAVPVPVVWQTPERAYQVKNSKELRDDAGALKLPIVSVERVGINKDPAKRGSFQANLYSSEHRGRSGRIVVAKRIVQDKTRNFAVASGTRSTIDVNKQRYSKRVNKKVVIQTVSIPIPVYVDVEYKVTIKTEYQQQINQLTTPFITRPGQTSTFTMTRNGHLYHASIQSSFAQSNVGPSMGEDSRLFSTDITINELGYLIGDGENQDLPIARIDENTVEYQWPQESVVPAGNINLFDD